MLMMNPQIIEPPDDTSSREVDVGEIVLLIMFLSKALVLWLKPTEKIGRMRVAANRLRFLAPPVHGL